MTKNNYGEFKYKGKNDNIDVLITIAKNNNGNIGEYQDEIFCPECGKARLKFTNETNNRRPFLSAIDSMEHSDSCNYLLPQLTKNQTKKIFEELTENESEDKMNALMRQLCINDEKNKKINPDSSETKANLFEVVSKKNTKSQVKSLKTKSLNKEISFENKNEDICAFYGKNVQLFPIEKTKDDKVYYLLGIKTENGDKEVYKTIKKNEFDQNSRYNIVCVGFFKFKKIQLIHKDKAIKIVEIE